MPRLERFARYNRRRIFSPRSFVSREQRSERAGQTAKPETEDDAHALGSSGGVTRLIKIGVVIFALIVGGIAIGALVAGDQTDLPFDYEGFD
jgi:hypothetical protein